MHGTDLDIWEIDPLRIPVLSDGRPRDLWTAFNQIEILEEIETEVFAEIVFASLVSRMKNRPKEQKDADFKILLRNFSIYLRRLRGETFVAISEYCGLSVPRTRQVYLNVRKKIYWHAEHPTYARNTALGLFVTLRELFQASSQSHFPGL
jgi:hypothetical protein